MNIPERGLGRGLGSLLSSMSEMPSGDKTKLALSQVVPGKHQPRKYFDEATLNDLAASIKKQGVIQPLLVRLLPGLPQRYEIVAGERRWRAARMAGLTEVPVIITEYTDREAMTVALIENLQRENLNPLEEAEAFHSLKETFGLSQEELAEQLGKSRSAVANALRLLQLPMAMKEGLLRQEITAGHARALLAVTDANLREQLYDAILFHHLSVREAEAAADTIKCTGRLSERLLPAHPSPAHRSPRPQFLRELQKTLRTSIGTRATISGDGSKGKIQIPYTSQEELERILRKMGISQ